ncbi:MAG: PIN domain-containing protein [Candidatus Diapherotrites archaeon]|nr:PIN domain-containing protein [Candidatus Diapherotrites archaeon]
MLVIDANIVVSALLKDSTTRKLLLDEKTPKLFAPEFIQEEIRKHAPEFAKKIGTSRSRIDETVALLFETSKTTVIEKMGYAGFLQEAQRISPDPNDTPYFALALKMDCPLWSNDSALKKQSRVPVFSTTELLAQKRKV